MSRSIAVVALSSVLASGLSACVTAPSPDEYRAPQPARSVDAERLWSGRWIEVARLPDRLTDGCVAGASNYVLVTPTRVDVRDTCERGQPGGSEKAIGGRGEILDPGTNAKLRVRYLAGFVTWDYWVLDHDDAYTWFISADPTFERLFIYTREVPTPAQRDRLTERARALGYDVSRLEFPAQPSR
ncbi:MAG: lipocalin family protein [Brevundimonas sp.]|nr:lipocalin family protein [Brevundimonas sp.]